MKQETITKIKTLLKFLIIFIIVEGSYILTRNIIVFNVENLINSEIYITIARIIAIFFYIVIFHKELKLIWKQNSGIKLIQYIIPVSLLMSVPLIINTNVFDNYIIVLVFAICTIPVAIKEELAYRALFQNFLGKLTNKYISIILINIIFTFYHAGYVNLNLLIALNIFLAGIFISIIFERTKNIKLCILIHLIYDLLFLIPPLIGPLNISIGTVIITGAILILLVLI